MITLRGYLFALLAPALLLLGDWLPFLVPAAVIYAIGLGIVLLADRYAAGKAGQFVIERLHETKLSLGAENLIRVRVRSRSQRGFEITLRDEIPLLFVGSGDLQGELRPLETIELKYYVRPLKRGDYEFGDMNIRWAGPLNFMLRQAAVPMKKPVKVYPNLHEIRKYDLLVRRDQLAEMGLKNVRLRGEGTQFESLRDYTTDDPYRKINWKATARRGKPISMDFEPERSQRVMIALDVGRMMRSPIRVDDPHGASWNMSKVDFVLNSALLFSYVATLKGDQVGILVFADRVQQFVAPQGGRAHFQQLLEIMYAVESQPVEADYQAALNFLRQQNKKRSLVVIFTDLSGPRALEELLTAVPRLAPRHLPMLVTIRDSALDDEAGQPPLDSDSVYRRSVAEQLLHERQILLENLGRRGVVTLDAAAEKMTMSVVSRYLELKARAYL